MGAGHAKKALSWYNHAVSVYANFVPSVIPESSRRNSGGYRMRPVDFARSPVAPAHEITISMGCCSYYLILFHATDFVN